VCIFQTLRKFFIGERIFAHQGDGNHEMDNRSGNTVQVVLDQTFLVDDNNRYWNLISNRTAVDV